jgi:hypothetical protein|tara:strand:- start:106 stop:279 length:174 start_codon:yes stop_codon:yes gene_type:complete
MSKTNVRIALTSTCMAVFLIAAAAADIVRNQDIFINGFSVNANIASTVSDWTPTRVQ